MILIFCLVGSYAINSNYYEVLIMLIFGGVGYLMRKAEFPQAPLVFALVLGPIMENALRQSLLHSRGKFSIFFTRPISLVLIMAGIAVLLIPLLSKVRGQRAQLMEKAPDD
jgi:putative tricarboxylic transport membrane protein